MYPVLQPLMSNPNIDLDPLDENMMCCPVVRALPTRPRVKVTGRPTRGNMQTLERTVTSTLQHRHPTTGTRRRHRVLFSSPADDAACDPDMVRFDNRQWPFLGLSVPDSSAVGKPHRVGNDEPLGTLKDGRERVQALRSRARPESRTRASRVPSASRQCGAGSRHVLSKPPPLIPQERALKLSKVNKTLKAGVFLSLMLTLSRLVSPRAWVVLSQSVAVPVALAVCVSERGAVGW